MEGVIDRVALAPGYSISRVIKGGWQLSKGHSAQRLQDPTADMFAFAELGIDSFDCADIYTGVEELIGAFRLANDRREHPLSLRVHTKFVPDFDALPTLTRRDVERSVDRSLARLHQERLDMLQFHWWNYDVPGWVETAHWLRDIQRSGKIELLSLTNFNSEKTQQILDAGITLSTTQVQYSLLDPRPEKRLVALCQENGMQLLCYGTLAGGFLSERWLGAADPRDFENRSLIKYRLMIEEIGGWDLLQALLQRLSSIATRHRTTIASVASRWVLEQPGVAAVIIGARNATHLDRYRELFRLRLSPEDNAAISQLRGQMRVPEFDVFDVEREKTGRHGRIMKYNLNAQ